MTTRPSPPSAPLFFSYAPRTQVILHSSLQVAQITASGFIPVYLITTLIARRRPFSVRSWMGQSIATTALAAAAGGGLAWYQTKGDGELAILGKVEKLSLDAKQIRRNDYTLISAALSGLVIPAIFLKRAPLPSLVLGGASIGLGAGVWYHWIQMFTAGSRSMDRVDMAPKVEVPVIGGTDKRL